MSQDSPQSAAGKIVDFVSWGILWGLETPICNKWHLGLTKHVLRNNDTVILAVWHYSYVPATGPVQLTRGSIQPQLSFHHITLNVALRLCQITANIGVNGGIIAQVRTAWSNNTKNKKKLHEFTQT